MGSEPLGPRSAGAAGALISRRRHPFAVPSPPRRPALDELVERRRAAAGVAVALARGGDEAGRAKVACEGRRVVSGVGDRFVDLPSLGEREALGRYQLVVTVLVVDPESRLQA